MSQRSSGYKRKRNDAYDTPAWVTEALIPHLPRKQAVIWEPAAGKGGMADVLAEHYRFVERSDWQDGRDFLSCNMTTVQDEGMGIDGIVTNPPFDQAQQFIEHAIELTQSSVDGFVAMLLRVDYDSAKTRQHLFGECPVFSKKLVLTRRIIWFPRSGAAPSYNHAWFIWDHKHRGPPTIAYSS